MKRYISKLNGKPTYKTEVLLIAWSLTLLPLLLTSDGTASLFIFLFITFPLSVTSRDLFTLEYPEEETSDKRKR